MHMRVKELLERYGSFPIHNRNLHILATEMFKVYNNIAPRIFPEIFDKQNSSYQLHHTSHFSVPRVRSVYNGTADNVSDICQILVLYNLGPFHAWW